MAFGTTGPPASAKQISYLTSLLEKAGYSPFREARHVYGLTQRQAGGKFTKQDASALIDRLINGDPPPDDGAPAGPDAAPAVDEAQAQLLHGVPASLLADELRRRGWHVQAP